MKISKFERISGAVSIRADSDGPKVLIFGGVHGDEISGVYAIEKLLFDFMTNTYVISNGSVVLVRANEKALGLGVRYLDSDLNRMFKDQYDSAARKGTYEFERAQELKTLLTDCEYFLDLHSAPIAQDPFVIAERQHTDFFTGLGIARFITGWAKFSGGSIGGDAENYANMNGGIGATLESGSHVASNAIKVAYEASLSMLSLLGMVLPTTQIKKVSPEIFEIYSVQLKQADDFRYEGEVTNFQFLPKGASYAVQGGSSLRVSEDSYLLIPMTPEQTKVGSEICYLGKRI
jgi:uncharacterized protein